MAMNLFEHNKTAYEAAVRMLTERGKAAVIHPTGTGKSFIGFKLCEDNPDKTICWLSPSRYIYQTQLENLAETSDGYQPENVKFYTYAKLMNVSEDEIAEIKPDYIVLDEFHRCGAEQWGAGVDAVLKAYPDVPVLGLSATAIRYLDNQRDMTDELFDGNVASEMTLGEAIVRGILNPPKYIMTVYSYQKELEKYEQRIANSKRKRSRDSAEKYLEALRRTLEQADGLDVIFDKHIEDRSGKYIVFCSSLDAMKVAVSKAKVWFSKVDKKPHIYTAYSNDPETSKAFADFKADKSDHMKLLYCIDMLNEGVHVEDISGVILLRPTISPIIYKQQIGRALSASKAKDPVIFDIVNNIENLYSIDTIAEEMEVAVTYYREHGGDSIIINETFEVVDEVGDCRQLFEKLEGTLSASWDLMYEKAKAYYSECGDLEVPRRYYTPDGYDLGQWLCTQRSIYQGNYRGKGKLTQVQIDRLNELGMRWETASDVAWSKYFAAAQKYYADHGDLLVPSNYVDDEGVKLGTWILSLRNYKRSGIKSNFLRSERVKQLEEMGMVWNTVDYIWEENYAEAAKYYCKHGDLEVPQGYVTDSGMKLGTWISNLRSRARRGELSEDRLQRLEEIGFKWRNKSEELFETGLAELEKYRQQFGNDDVDYKYVTDSGFKLGEWIYRVRLANKNGKLPESRKQILLGKGVNIGLKDNWDTMMKLVEEYYAENGDANIPANCVIKGVWLNRWLNEQRRISLGTKKGSLTEEQKKRLEAVGVKLGMTKQDEIWFGYYDKVKAYYDENGNIDISASHKTEFERTVGKWLGTQRTLKKQGKLTDRQIQLLDEFGMEWRTPDEVRFDEGIEKLTEYIERTGSTQVPSMYCCEDGFQLGRWLLYLRQKYSKDKDYLTNDQIARFDKLGFDLSMRGDVWQKRYEEVCGYFTLHNVTKLPMHYKSADGVDLYDWIIQQKRAYKEQRLAEDRAVKLRKIGIRL